LVATITDNPALNASGVVETGIGAPTLYWRYQPDGGSFGDWDTIASTSLGSDQYAFLFGAGVPDGATVEYFVGAQDNDGNVAVYPATGADGLMLDPPGDRKSTRLNSSHVKSSYAV